jgi:DNA-binding LacI/PurR family transcriptional regulator
MGVSIASVSRALNGKSGLSPELRQKILDEAAQRNTYITHAARMLATARSQNVCFVVYHVAGPISADPFYFQILMGLEAELRKAGLHLTLEVIDEDVIKDPMSWRTIRERRADGIILTGPYVPSQFILKLHRAGIPLVLIDNYLEHAQVDSVAADDRASARILAEHVISLGHKDVAIISGPTEWYSSRERTAGFKEAFELHKIKEPTVYVGDETTFESGKLLFEKAIKKSCTAILAVTDPMALGAMSAAVASGLRIPEDLSITGFDDIDSAANAIIPLTTINVPRNYLGLTAARLLWARLDDKEAPRQRIDITANLIIRKSTGPAKKVQKKGKND